MGKVINGELCKKINFDQTDKWYTHNPESVLQNETHKILWDFEIQMDHLISARRPDLRDSPHQKNRNCRNVDLIESE